MKKIMLFIALFTSVNLCASPVDSISVFESEISTLKKENYALKAKVSELDAKLESTKNNLNLLSEKINAKVDSVNNLTTLNSENIKQTAEKLGVELKNQSDDLKSSISNINNTLGNKIIWTTAFVALLLIIIVAYIIWARKKSNSTDYSIKLLKDAQKNLEVQSVKLDNQLIDILEKKMKAESESKPTDAEPDHSLPLKVADEIVRIQNNIDRMDPSDKNVIRLNKALDRMKTSFTAYGYEIVDMRGQEYTDNMPFEVRFIPDDEIEEGKRIISGMDRLMV